MRVWRKLCQLIFVGLLSHQLTACTFYHPYPDPQTTYEQSKWLGQNGVGLVVVGDQTRVLLPADKFFYVKSSEFKPGCRPILEYISHMLLACPNSPITISGHTDDIGNVDDNLILSDHQAYTIASYFWSMGVPWDRMNIEGHADHLQIASDDTIWGSWANRRIEVRMD